MSMFDNLKGKADQLREKAEGFIDENADKIKDGIEKAGDFVDEKTGGRFSEQVDNVQTGAANLVDKASTDDIPAATDPIATDPVQPGTGPAPRDTPPAG